MTKEENLAALLREHAAGRDLPRYVPQIAFTEALARGDDPLHILPYLADVGVAVSTMEDLQAAGDDPGEEEMCAFRVEEGVAVLLESDGLWLLFTR